LVLSSGWEFVVYQSSTRRRLLAQLSIEPTVCFLSVLARRVTESLQAHGSFCQVWCERVYLC